MKRTKWNPRKVLVASAGVATINYAAAAGCGGEASITVANLVPCPPHQCLVDDSGFGGASVANLVAPPPDGGGNGGFAGASVANLVAPPVLPDAGSPDASPPPDDAGAADAAPDGAA